MDSENTNKTQMRKGILDYCILLILSRKDAYASDLLNTLKSVDMLIVEGTLYPLLTRLKNNGMLSYRWEESQQGPPRKYYAVTEAGKKMLAELDASWTSLQQSIESLKNDQYSSTEEQEQYTVNN